MTAIMDLLTELVAWITTRFVSEHSKMSNQESEAQN